MWIRNLTCHFLGAKARPQSQGISLAALVALNPFNRLVAKPDIGREDGKRKKSGLVFLAP